MIERQGRSRTAQVRAVSQVTFSIATSDALACFDRVRNETLEWIARRAGQPLPADAWAGKSFDLQDVGAQRTAAVSLQSPKYWAARLDDADRSVPQRTWITEIGIGIRSSAAVLVGCRLYCVALGANPPYQATVPGFVRQIASREPATVDGRKLSDAPWLIQSASDVDDLTSFLCSLTRSHPVVVVTEGSNTEDPAIDEGKLAAAVLGVAHVVRLSRSAGFHLTRKLGKEFSVFDGAVRTYRAGFDPDKDEPSSHPLALARSIAGWENDGARAFERFLTQQAMWESVARGDLEREVPSFAAVLVRAAQEARSVARLAGQSDAELLALASDEIKQLEGRAEEERRTFDGLLVEAEKERDRAIAAAEGARSEAASLRSRIAHLEHALLQQGPAKAATIPATLEDLGEWGSLNLAGSVVLLNRALRAAKKSAFENARLAYEALLVLRDCYVPMRRGSGNDSREEYTRRLMELGLEESASFTGSRAAEQGDEYFVDYGGRRRELDRHLKGSSSRDIRFGFRLYFFWDEDTQQVVVGSLPGHLSTRAS